MPPQPHPTIPDDTHALFTTFTATGFAWLAVIVVVLACSSNGRSLEEEERRSRSLEIIT